MSKLPFEDGDVVRLKVSGLYLSPAADGLFESRASTPGPDDPGQFTMVRKGGRAWAFQSVQLKPQAPPKKYITISANGSVLCNASVPLSSETFVLKGCDPRNVQFENQGNGKLLMASIPANNKLEKFACIDRAVGEGKTDFEIERQ
jgi:hypothetical protein